jgi:hypothetical protein
MYAVEHNLFMVSPLQKEPFDSTLITGFFDFMKMRSERESIWLININ